MLCADKILFLHLMHHSKECPRWFACFNKTMELDFNYGVIFFTIATHLKMSLKMTKKLMILIRVNKFSWFTAFPFYCSVGVSLT